MTEANLPELPELPPQGYGNDGWCADQMRAYGAECVRLERERAEQDAKRYRWLREESCVAAVTRSGVIGLSSGSKHPEDWRLLDEAIDARILAADTMKEPT